MFDFRRDDRDDKKIYGGISRVPARDGIPATPTFIDLLQAQLLRLGFRVVQGCETGVFDLKTEWGVREFQAYAKMPSVRQGEGAAATAVDIPISSRYDGPVCGVANARTRELLAFWDLPANNYRCPVVISAFQFPGDGATWPDSVPPGTQTYSHPTSGGPLNGGNIWTREQMPSTTPRIYASDLSSLYVRTSGTAAENDLGNFQVLGTFANTYNTGPLAQPPNHVWPEAEVNDQMFGPAPPGNEQKLAFFSTFKTIAAVARVECIGYLDCVNAYDKAIQSIGLVHWTLALPIEKQGVPHSGEWTTSELPATFAYLACAAGDQEYDSRFGRYGLGVTPSWTLRAGGASGLSLRNETERKFQGLITLQSEDGRFDARAWTHDEIEYFRNWHWFYRFVMAGRLPLAGQTESKVPKPLWDMARVRLRDLLQVNWPADASFPHAGQGSAVRLATMGETLTSEKAIAILVRWHVLRPGKLLSTSSTIAENDLRQIWQLVTTDGGTAIPVNIADWCDRLPADPG